MKNIFILLQILITLQAMSQDSVSVLFIGNSYIYSNDLPGTFNQLSSSLGKTVTIDSKVNGGYTFQMHANDPVTYSKIDSKPWDYVILQGQSQEPSFPTDQVNNQTLPFAMDLADSVYANAFCSQAMYFMTWGRENGDPQWDSINTFYKMNDRLRNAYLRFADSVEGCVTPVGAAWRYVRDNHPEILLYSGDGSHPSPAGTYLAACTFYASVFRQSPVGASYQMGLDPLVAANLQAAAALTVLDSLETWHIRSKEDITQAYFSYTQNDPTISCVNSSWRAETFEWSFGDGITSTDANPVHTYGTNGNFTIQLIASSSCGSDTLEMQVTVNAMGMHSSSSEELTIAQVGPNKYTLSSVEPLMDFVILNSMGQRVKYFDSNQLTSGTIEMDLQPFGAGIYLLKHLGKTHRLVVY